MTPDPACCAPDTSLDEVARMMVRHDTGEIPVIDHAGRPVGVVTDRDIVRRVVAAGSDPRDRQAATCMSGPAITVALDAPFLEVVVTMEVNEIHRLPVVDERGRCAGMISRADVARAASEHEGRMNG